MQLTAYQFALCWAKFILTLKKLECLCNADESFGIPHAQNILRPAANLQLQQGKVYFALEGMCPHSPTHWICFEKCANIHLNAKLILDVSLHIS
jgi:hypothetical protein